MLRCSFIVDPRTVTAIFAFILTVLLSAPAGAQTPAPPPVFPAVDGHGVDVATGAFNHSQTDVVIGQPGAGGLAFTRHYVSGGWTNNHIGYIAANGTTCSVVIGAMTETFTSASGCTGVFTSNQQRGSSLAADGQNYIYTSSDGVIATFAKPVVPQYGYHMFLNMPGIAYLVSVTTPTGERLTYGYETSTPPCPYLPDWWACQYWTEVSYSRLSNVLSNSGYLLRFSYPGTPEQMVQPSAVTGINLAIEYCVPGSCVNSWPSASYAYGGGGYSSVTDATGATTTYSYSGNLLTEIQFPDNPDHDINIGYGAGGVASVDLGYGAWSYGYTNVGNERTTTVTNPDASAQSYVSYLDTGRIKSVTNELGKTLSYQYDGAARPTRVTMPEGNYVQYTYDSRGNVTETRQVSKTPGTPGDIVTSASYSASCGNPRTCNQPTSTTDARGYRTDYTHDATHGGVLTVTAPAPSGSAPVGSGARPQVRYGYAQFQARYQTAAGWLNGSAVWRRTTTSSCATEAPACVGTANETLVTTSYPSAGTPNNLLPAAQTTTAGNGSLSATTTLTYTKWSDVLTVDGPLAGSADTTRLYYDAGRRVTGLVGPDPDGGGALIYRAVRTTYNVIGQPTQVERGTVTSQSDSAFTSFATLEKQDTAFDAFARPVLARLWNGGTLLALSQTNYDSRGRAVCAATRMNPALFTNPPADACTPGSEGGFGADRIRRTIYDLAGRVSQAQSAVGTALAQTTATYAYTANGLVDYFDDARGNRTDRVYDGFDRLERTHYPVPNPVGAQEANSGDFEQFGYDAAGRLVFERRRSGEYFSFGYDNLNRMTLRDPPGAQPDVTFTYDLLGRMVSESQAGQTLSTAYDALSRVTSVTSSVLGTVGYQYDTAGRRTRLSYPGGFYVTYAYNTVGELTDLFENGATRLAQYRYDNLGRRTERNLRYGTKKVEMELGYDAASRLATLVQNPDGGGYDTNFGYAYNPASQMTSRTRSNAAYDWVLPSGYSESYAADGLNRYTSARGATPTYDMRGNLTGDGARTYGYDYDNRLISASGGVGLAYDPAGRLHEVSAPGGTTRFLYDGNDVIAEYNTSGTVLRRYVHGPGLDEPLVWYEGSGTGDRRYLLADERGSVIGVTNASGQVTTVNKYDAYGVPDANNQGRFQYTGQMWLPELELYHYKARVYHPKLGRFMQTDPIGTAGGINLYAYTGNDPVNATDPSGLIDCLGGLPSNGNNDSCAPVPPGVCYATRIDTLGSGSICGGNGPLIEYYQDLYIHNLMSRDMGPSTGICNSKGCFSTLVADNQGGRVKDESDLKFTYGLQGGGRVGLTKVLGAKLDIDLGSREVSLVTGKKYVNENYTVGVDVLGFSFGIDASRNVEIGNFRRGIDSIQGILGGREFDFKPIFQTPWGVSASEFWKIDFGVSFGLGLEGRLDF